MAFGKYNMVWTPNLTFEMQASALERELAKFYVQESKIQENFLCNFVPIKTFKIDIGHNLKLIHV